ncbi:MAG: hypothetical protein AAGP08_19715, partial [Pseudomonadota bacterium]
PSLWSAYDVKPIFTKAGDVGVMEFHDVTFKLPDVQLQALRRIAERDDVSVGQVLRNAISNEVRRATRNAKTPNRADEQLLAPLRALLASDFAEARTWHDLAGRLKDKGYELREAGGGLALHTAPEGHRLCKASELGHAYGALLKRFRAPFPGHSHAHLVQRYLGTDQDED